MYKKRMIIIGAGVSGLYAATLLQEYFDITILEARGRIGGRVLSIDEHDLGPSWIWSHQKSVLSLIASLGLELSPQYTQGSALYDVPESVQRFTSPPSAPSARINGGILRLVQALEQMIDRKDLHLNEKVLSIRDDDTRVLVSTDTSEYAAEYVISTLPLRLASSTIDYLPTLDDKIRTQMQDTPTWMGGSVKCVVEYKDAFWRKAGLSGLVFSHRGPLGEIHDACTQDRPALFGFMHSHAETADLKEAVTVQMVRLFGPQASTPLAIHIMDWRKEIFTSTPQDAIALSTHPSYGLEITHLDGKLLFIGAETSFEEGGYLEGALISAKKVTATLI